MSSHAVIPPPPLSPPPPPPQTSPRQHSLEESEGYTIHVAYTQQQALSEWLFASVPDARSTHTLPTLHRITLIHGLVKLRQHITELIDLDIELYHKYVSLLADEEYTEKASAYTGWLWVSPSESTLEILSRGELESLL